MRLHHNLTRLAAFLAAGILVSACSETQFLVHTAKRLNNENRSGGTYKVGNPYEIDGKTYYPAEDWSYDETGIASWYGPQFHGKATANGEVFDQWQVSAAHKTLPMPSMVRVTNLENGRSLVVRVNDRGPFAHSRIIDMSRRAAQLLGFETKGTARVRVQILADESKALAERLKSGQPELAAGDRPIADSQTQDLARVEVATEQLPPPENAAVETASLEPVPPAEAAPQVTQVPVTPTGLYVQAGAFGDITNAERVRVVLKNVGDVHVSMVEVGGRELFRVRVGPVQDVEAADRLLAQVIEAGYPEARTVVVAD